MSEPKTGTTRDLDLPGAIEAHEVEHRPTRIPIVPAWYGLYFMAMSKTARECGYALALHGSLARDCDLLAAPWTDEAVSAEELVAALVERHGVILGTDGMKAKPHGRVACSLMMGGHCYFDVSIMPRNPVPGEGEDYKETE